jgi:DNA repair protein RadC
MEATVSIPAYMMVSEIEIVYKSKVKASQRPILKTAKESYELLLRFWNDDKLDLVEEFKVLLLNQSGRVLALVHLSSGGITSTIADQRLIFGISLKAAATSIIVAHSHPSGSIRPSKADELFTQQLVQAGEILNIKVADHIIVTREHYYSFAEEGLL